MTLSVPDLVEEAATPGGGPFVANLELLVRSCLDTANLNDTGRRVLQKVAVRHLRNLSYVQAYRDTHPGVAGRALDAPIVVTGLPRTGTTLLHNLLACDPDHRVLRFWEALRPVPPGDGGPTTEELRSQAGRWLERFYRLVPEFRAIHGATPTGPEECDALLQNTFASQHFDDMFDARDYARWLASAPLVDEYGHYAVQLQVLSEAPGATWALKSPSHLGHLDALLGALPGVTVVVCHRHPRQAVPSYASLIAALRRAYSAHVAPEVVGRQALERGALAMTRAMEVRAASGDAAFVDVSYRELVRDPIGALRRIYDRRGRPLLAATEERMREWLASNPQHKHGAHRYALEEFGLTASEVDAAFAAYLEGYGAFVS